MVIFAVIGSIISVVHYHGMICVAWILTLANLTLLFDLFLDGRKSAVQLLLVLILWNIGLLKLRLRLNPPVIAYSRRTRLSKIIDCI